MAYHEGKGLTYLFGHHDTAAASDIWSWDGDDWVNVTPTTGSLPPQTNEHTMIYEPNTDMILVFGGMTNTSGASATNALWAWDGEAWYELSPNDPSDSSKPSPRLEHAMVYDPVSNDVFCWRQ